MDNLQYGYGFDIYSSVTKWQTGVDMINNQNCLAINIGSNGEIPLPTISLPIDIRQQLDQYEFEKSYNCFFVFVGGKYVEEMKIVVDVVEDISEQFHGIKPLAVFVMGQYNLFSNFSTQGQGLIKVSQASNASKIMLLI